MFEAFLRIIDGDNQLPENMVYDRLDILDRWGCERVYLVGWDVHRHRSFWDILTHVREETGIDDVVAFSQGKWVTGDKLNRAYGMGVEYVVPIDFVNPFEDEVFGGKNYSNPSHGLLSRYPDAEIWQTVLQENAPRVQNYVSAPFDWIGHEPPHPKYGSIPDDLGGWLEENEQVVYGKARWLFVHAAANNMMGYPQSYQSEIIENATDTAGSLYIGYTGRLEPPLTFELDGDYRIESMDERDLRDFASSLESEWKGR